MFVSKFGNYNVYLYFIMKKKDLLSSYAMIHSGNNYPPIAGKILGLFFISNQKYYAFEENHV